ncbi:hypothetical protein MMC10_002749 [Thelotrema lepadinum]|nr:hypothetical protein [Thelotrema lepadinum]
MWSHDADFQNTIDPVTADLSTREPPNGLYKRASHNIYTRDLADLYDKRDQIIPRDPYEITPRSDLGFPWPVAGQGVIKRGQGAIKKSMATFGQGQDEPQQEPYQEQDSSLTNGQKSQQGPENPRHSQYVFHLGETGSSKSAPLRIRNKNVYGSDLSHPHWTSKSVRLSDEEKVKDSKMPQKQKKHKPVRSWEFNPAVHHPPNAI